MLSFSRARVAALDILPFRSAMAAKSTGHTASARKVRYQSTQSMIVNIPAKITSADATVNRPFIVIV